MRDLIIGFIGFDLVLLLIWSVVSPSRIDDMKVRGNQRLLDALSQGLESYYSDVQRWPEDLKLDSKNSKSIGPVLVGLGAAEDASLASEAGEYGKIESRGPDPLIYTYHHMIGRPIRDANRPQALSDAWDTIFHVQPHENNSLLVVSAGPDRTFDTADDMSTVAQPQPLAVGPTRADYRYIEGQKFRLEQLEIRREQNEAAKKNEARK